MNIGEERAIQAQKAADIIAQAGIEFFAAIEDANATRPTSATIGNALAYDPIRGTEYKLTLHYEPLHPGSEDDVAIHSTVVIFIPQTSPSQPDALLALSYGQYNQYNEYTPEDFDQDTEDQEMDNVTFTNAYLAKKAEIERFAALIDAAQDDHPDVPLIAFLEDDENFTHAG